ncbi:VENN motif pre-toxin domain-containing protein [Cronobacter muytjensii]|nr:VENN motif pre-toxin domain-containing protein [Cronobacter muytjensii]MDI6457919.1 VENN motif pre-toxin domain-containing protein [Cronobacter muytjensii]
MAKAQGKDALAGAAGASTGELTAKLALDLYGKKPEQLGEDERQLVSSLSSVAAGLAGAAVSNNTASVQTAAQAGKNAVENNFLKNNEPETFAKKLADCGYDGGCRADVMKEMVETSNKNIDEFSDCMKAGNKACVDNQLNDIANATGFDALTAEIGTDAVNAYKDGMGVEAFNNAIDCMGMGWEACSNKKGWKLVESGSGVLIIAGGQTIGGKLAEAIAGSKGNANTNIQPGSKQPVQIEKLNQKQESAIRKIDNSIKNGLKDHDIAGTLKDMDGNPVPEPGGGY